MKKSYLFLFSDEFGSRENVKNYINSMNEITHWRYDIQNSFYIISEYSAEYLAKKLREFSETGRFVITEFSNNAYGWLTEKSFYLIQNKEYK